MLAEKYQVTDLSETQGQGVFDQKELDTIEIIWPIIKTNIGCAEAFSKLKSPRERQSVTTKVNNMIGKGSLQDFAVDGPSIPNVRFLWLRVDFDLCTCPSPSLSPYALLSYIFRGKKKIQLTGSP